MSDKTLTIVEGKPKKLRAWDRLRKGMRPERNKSRSKPTSLSKAIKDADTKVSLHVRHSRADSEGMVKCYTCSVYKHVKKIQNGHYVPRIYKMTRWDLDNCRPQCMACNMIKKGNSHIYRENLVKEIGEERVQGVETRSKIPFTMPLSAKLDFINSQLSLLTHS